MIGGKIFWLHIKKSGGTSIRNILGSNYIQVERENRPSCFIQSNPNQYNDILNNYRVVLGKYQFKRALFAKKFLYPDAWNDKERFAFSREPIQRNLSMFFYLYWQSPNYNLYIKKLIKNKRFYTISYAFDQFLEDIEYSQTCGINTHPHGLHFSTHTARMWDDITDTRNKVLINNIFRLEDMKKGIETIYEKCNINANLASTSAKLNKTKKQTDYSPNHNQLKKIKKLYSKDFDIYESTKPLN